MKKYLRVTPEGKDVWMDKPEEATADYYVAVVATQERLNSTGLKTTLLEIPDPHLMPSKWVICTDDVVSRSGYGKAKKPYFSATHRRRMKLRARNTKPRR